MNWPKLFLLLLCTVSVCADIEVAPDEGENPSYEDLAYLDDDLVHIVQVLKIKNLLSLRSDCQALCSSEELARMCNQCKSRQPYRFG